MPRARGPVDQDAIVERRVGAHTPHTSVTARMAKNVVANW